MTKTPCPAAILCAAALLALVPVPAAAGPLGAAGALVGVAECVAVPTFAEAAASGLGNATATATVAPNTATDGPRMFAAATFAAGTALTSSSSASVSGTFLGGNFSASASCSFSLVRPIHCSFLDALRPGVRTAADDNQAVTYDGEIVRDPSGAYHFQGTKKTSSGTAAFSKGFDGNNRLVLEPGSTSDDRPAAASLGCPKLQANFASTGLLQSTSSMGWR